MSGSRSRLAAPVDGKTREDCEREYTPQRGQAGKDVIWVPTGDEVVTRMLELAKVTSTDHVYDLGAGDGKIPIAATKQFGATAVGVEYDADLVKYAQCVVEAEGVQGRVTVVQGDIFETDFSDATVVTLYLLPELNLRLRPDAARHATGYTRGVVLLHDAGLALRTTMRTLTRAWRICGSCRRRSAEHGRSGRSSAMRVSMSRSIRRFRASRALRVARP